MTRPSITRALNSAFSDIIDAVSVGRRDSGLPDQEANGTSWRTQLMLGLSHYKIWLNIEFVGISARLAPDAPRTAVNNSPDFDGGAKQQ